MPASERAHAPAHAALLRALGQRWPLGLVALAAAAVAAPVALLSLGTERARACVAAYEAPRDSALPDCRREVPWFVTPSRIPWTATPARYRAEEIGARAAVAAYTDAAVGRPDAGALAPAAEGLAAAEKVIAAGSQRVALEELGPAVGAPDVGRSAALLGDRRALLAQPGLWPHWSVNLRALEAALIEGDVPRAAALARRYAEWDPRDEELRTAIAAMLCLGDGGKRGLELLATVQADRAKDRHESWTRNWGDVRAAIVACAAKAGLPPPPAPERADAGSGDLPEARTALRLRLLARAPRDEALLKDAAAYAIQVLRQGPLPKGARVPLVAALLATRHEVSPTLGAILLTPNAGGGEAALRPTAVELTAAEWLNEPRAVRPTAAPEALRDAVGKLQRLAADEDLTAEERAALTTGIAATALAAARASALAGDAAAAAEALERAGATIGAGDRALARSSAWYAAGDGARALAELEREPDDVKAAGALRAAWLLQRAELLASAGRREEAARVATAADEAAAAAGDRRLDVRTQWTRLALARTRRSPVPASPVARVWPWVGPMATPSSWLDPAAEGFDGAAGALAQALAFWDGARAASPEEHRALRYAAFGRHAGDAPRAWAAYLQLAGELLPPGDGDVEVWLDAFTATASRATTLRGYVWARAEAARFRGDASAAARWSERYRALVKLAAPAENAEIAALLGL